MFVPFELNEEGGAQINKLDHETKENLINKCGHALIILAQNRQPIKKQDLNRLAFLSVTNYRLSNAITILANKKLRENIGMRLYETECKTKFILVNADVEYAQYASQSKDLKKELSVLYFILIDIFASAEECVTEEDLGNSLKPLNLTIDELKCYLDSFIKKLYLVQRKKDNTRIFFWGPRAIAEVEPDNFFRRFLDLAGEQNDKNWPEHKRRIDHLKALRNC